MVSKDNFDATKWEGTDEPFPEKIVSYEDAEAGGKAGKFSADAWFVEDEASIRANSNPAVDARVKTETELDIILPAQDSEAEGYEFVDNKANNKDTTSSASSRAKYLFVIIIIILITVAFLIMIFFGFTDSFSKRQEDVNTVSETTQGVLRPTQAPGMENYQMYIDEQNKSAYTLLNWTQEKGDFDGYEIIYGVSDNAYPGTAAKWVKTITVDGSRVCSHKQELEYASDGDIDMARIRTYYYENGEKICGEWSNIIYLDYNNKNYILSHIGGF